MSGKIEVKVRQGVSKDKRYNYYPEWYLEVTDENGIDKVKLSPTFEELCEVLKKIIQHERKVNHTRDRKKEALKRAEELIISVLRGLENNNSIEEIYLKQKKDLNLINYK